MCIILWRIWLWKWYIHSDEYAMTSIKWDNVCIISNIIHTLPVLMCIILWRTWLWKWYIHSDEYAMTSVKWDNVCIISNIIHWIDDTRHILMIICKMSINTNYQYSLKGAMTRKQWILENICLMKILYIQNLVIQKW